MCRSLDEGGRRCPGGHSSTRHAQTARQRLCRARKTLASAEASGDPDRIRSARQRVQDAETTVATIKTAQNLTDTPGKVTAGAQAALPAAAHSARFSGTRDRLAAVTSRTEATGYLDGLKKADLIALAGEVGIEASRRDTVKDLKAAIVEVTVGGGRLDRAAIRAAVAGDSTPYSPQWQARNEGDVTSAPDTSASAAEQQRDVPTQDKTSEMSGIPTQTVESAAADLGVSVSTVQRWLRTGEIRKHGVTGHKDSRGRWVITLLDDAPGSSHAGDAPGTGDARIEAQIRAAYDLLARRPGAWVGLADVRELVDAPRDQVDDVLRRLERRPDVNMVPESNQKTLRPEDREAAINIGAQDKHLIWFDPGRT
ncbi:hypothetical protein ACWDA3_59140 [Nonomuraea rubra]